MSKDTQKVKVLEIIGGKLDPNATYLFVWNIKKVTTLQVTHLKETLAFSGDAIKSYHVGVQGNPKDALQVYSIPKSEE